MANDDQELDSTPFDRLVHLMSEELDEVDVQLFAAITAKALKQNVTTRRVAEDAFKALESDAEFRANRRCLLEALRDRAVELMQSA